MAHDVFADLVATVLEVAVREGEEVVPGRQMFLLESMKMEIPVVAEVAGTVLRVEVAPGDTVRMGGLLAVLS